MPTIVELKKLLTEKGIQFKSKDLKADLEKLLKGAEARELTRKSSRAEARELTPKSARAEARELSPKSAHPHNSATVVSAIDAKRLLVIVKDESEQEINYFCSGYGTLCTNFVFEKSTGTSNIYNFRNTFLPIMRQEKGGWLNKASDLQYECVFYVSQMVYTIMKNHGHSEECIKEAFVFLNEFLSRFGCWKHLQISAALSDDKDKDIWNSTVIGGILKNITFNYNFYPMKINKFNPDTEEILEKLEFGREFKKSLGDRVYDSSRELSISLPKVNARKSTRSDISIFPNALTINRKSNPNPINIVQWGQEGFFYKRKTPIVHLQIEEKHFAKIADKSSESVNEWLENNSALCLKEDSNEGPAGHSSKADRVDRADRVLDDDSYFSGWRTILECSKK
jgi:hypothetical protein